MNQMTVANLTENMKCIMAGTYTISIPINYENYLSEDNFVCMGAIMGTEDGVYLNRFNGRVFVAPLANFV